MRTRGYLTKLIELCDIRKFIFPFRETACLNRIISNDNIIAYRNISRNVYVRVDARPFDRFNSNFSHGFFKITLASLVTYRKPD